MSDATAPNHRASRDGAHGPARLGKEEAGEAHALGDHLPRDAERGTLAVARVSLRVRRVGVGVEQVLELAHLADDVGDLVRARKTRRRGPEQQRATQQRARRVGPAGALGG
jgi:hypothetical protein